MPRYEHTQHSPLWYALLLPMLGGIVIAGMSEEAGLIGFGVAAAVAFAVLAASFGTLTVQDAGEVLRVRFGPLPLFGTSVQFAAIQSVRATRSRLIDGWGVHWIPGRGWTFNLWGFDCVEVTTDRGLLRIGTDDPAGLVAFLAAAAPAPTGRLE
ncbi:MAG: hypothetical protein NXI31_19240 [bacterium]|nr:hypothetical protein [bacterium]